MAEIAALFQKNKEKILQDYFTFLKFPSVSTEASFQPQVIACAHWLADYLKAMGFEVEIWETKGHPTIFASHCKAGKDKPTLMLYHHYDVQPVDPLSEWKSPPFEPTIRDGQVYARGAQDNKGQCFYTIQALKLMLEKEGKLPLNIKFCIEGEEEAGSVNLAALLQQKKEQLKADYLAIVDTFIKAANQPSLSLGIRGLITFDIELQGAKTDLHSGSHGGLVYNPLHAMVELLSALRDQNGKITVEGFYDNVVELTEQERASIAWDFDPAKYEQMFGAKPTGGEQKFSHLERNWVRPTIEINGISGGYTGSGFKTVIPAKATAKFSARLVPNQDPVKVGKAIISYLEARIPKGIQAKIECHQGGGPAVHAAIDSKAVQAFAKAFEEVFHKPCQFVYEGASIPIIAKMAAATQAQLVLVGVGLSDDQIHAPNEHFGLDRFEKGLLVMAKAIQILGKNHS